METTLKEIYELLSVIKDLIYMGIIYTIYKTVIADKERSFHLYIYSALMFVLVLIIQFS